jgi:conjugal transfer pilus assembly protein TraW
MNKYYIHYGILIKIFLALTTTTVILLAAANHANAKDFGNHGHIFTILEEDILAVIKRSLEQVDLDALNQKMRQQTINYAENPKKVIGITNYKPEVGEGNKEFLFDPTYTVAADIFDHHGNLMHARGKKVNPLEYVPLRESLIFINGDNEEQIKLALSFQSSRENKVKIILVAGHPLKIQREHKIWIYFDQAGILTTKLGITQVPALVEQDGLRLKIKLIDVKGDLK